MASMTIRNIDDQLKIRLRMRAASRGRSMEDEARDILRTALAVDDRRGGSLVDSIRARIEPVGAAEIALAPREPIRESADIDR